MYVVYKNKDYTRFYKRMKRSQIRLRPLKDIQKKLASYPGKKPVIVYYEDIQYPFLMDGDMTFSALAAQVRHRARVQVSDKGSLFFRIVSLPDEHVIQTLPCAARKTADEHDLLFDHKDDAVAFYHPNMIDTIAVLYNQYKLKDQCLHVTVVKEETLG